jgi:hypothetical protein
MSIPWFARLGGPVLIGYFESRWGRHHAQWSRKHPFDQLHRVDTSGFVPGFLLTLSFTASRGGAARNQSQGPRRLPEPQQCRFLDLGCGEGRPLLVATQFGFSEITRVELLPGLARVARRNAGILANAYPDRTRINIIMADATKYRLPAESLVVFLYNARRRDRGNLRPVGGAERGRQILLTVVCHERRMSDLRRATVREMKEGPSS